MSGGQRGRPFLEVYPTPPCHRQPGMEYQAAYHSVYTNHAAEPDTVAWGRTPEEALGRCIMERLGFKPSYANQYHNNGELRIEVIR